MVHGRRSTYIKHGCRCEVCRAAQAAYQAIYFQAHREDLNQRQRAQYQIHKDEIREHQARYEDEHRESIRAQRHSVAGKAIARKHASAKRARKRDQFVEQVDHMAVYARDKGRCGICGITVYGDFHIDHVIPLSRGGPDSLDNLQTLCYECNRGKRDSLQ